MDLSPSRPAHTPAGARPTTDFGQLAAATQDLEPPYAVVDLAALRHNVSDLVRRAERHTYPAGQQVGAFPAGDPRRARRARFRRACSPTRSPRRCGSPTTSTTSWSATRASDRDGAARLWPLTSGSRSRVTVMVDERGPSRPHRRGGPPSDDRVRSDPGEPRASTPRCGSPVVACTSALRRSPVHSPVEDVTATGPRPSWRDPGFRAGRPDGVRGADRGSRRRPARGVCVVSASDAMQRTSAAELARTPCGRGRRGARAGADSSS